MPPSSWLSEVVVFVVGGAAELAAVQAVVALGKR